MAFEAAERDLGGIINCELLLYVYCLRCPAKCHREDGKKGSSDGVRPLGFAKMTRGGDQWTKVKSMTGPADRTLGPINSRVNQAQEERTHKKGRVRERTRESEVTERVREAREEGHEATVRQPSTWRETESGVGGTEYSRDDTAVRLSQAHQVSGWTEVLEPAGSDLCIGEREKAPECQSNQLFAPVV